MIWLNSSPGVLLSHWNRQLKSILRNFAACEYSHCSGVCEPPPAASSGSPPLHTLSFRPQRPPEPEATMRFPLTYRGQILDVEIDRDSTTYSLREGQRLAIRHEGEEIVLTRENPSVSRSTMDP